MTLRRPQNALLIAHGLQWLLTLMPSIWMSTVFVASFRGWMLVGYLPRRALEMVPEDRAALAQDALFQSLFNRQEQLFGAVALTFPLWVLMTLVMAAVVGVRKKRDRWLSAGRYLLLHVGLYALQILIFAAEPTHRAGWLWD